jgi:hypothetical protein
LLKIKIAEAEKNENQAEIIKLFKEKDTVTDAIEITLEQKNKIQGTVLSSSSSSTFK